MPVFFPASLMAFIDELLALELVEVGTLGNFTVPMLSGLRIPFPLLFMEAIVVLVVGLLMRFLDCC